MIVLSNSTELTIQPGAAVPFDRIVRRSYNCGVCVQNAISAPKLCKRGIYEVSFSGNIGGTTAAAPVQLSVQLGGVTLPETTMISVPAAVGDLNNVATTTYVNRGCCPDMGRLTVVNTGTTPVTLGANSAFAINRSNN